MTVQNAFEEFIHSRKLKGLAESTIKNYRLLTSCFIRYISPDFDMEDIKQTHIDSFIDFLYSRMVSRATIATYIRNTRIFLHWYEKKHPVSYCSSEITVPKTPKKIIYLYSLEDIKQIFNAVESSVPWIVARNKAIIALMLDSGLRQCEVCPHVF